ncbi:hypothetical protein CLV92_11427 [Kineococcus xinjiangensis]|uniref:Small ligand-binding sensory domain FIST n=1 Tax=Kineococcus xinjiangensis TaxID=512762 RepID=A0A2S6IE09_9ACTN|nr:FIST N-terminal domain-containing protein [Kineococcus xinjiangensis]PPK92426.1 hypothetical protein CLV92_11427 [Kineococcus xinjiangensis]
MTVPQLDAGTMGVGHSGSPDPRQAARECVQAALAGRTPQPGDLLVVFTTVGEDVPAFFDEAAAAAGAATVVGCSAYGCYTTEAPGVGGCSAAYLPAGDLTFGVGTAESLGSDIAAATEAAVVQARADAGGSGEHDALLLMSDGLAGDQREVLRGAYRAAGAQVAIVGGAAADSLTQTGTYQYARGRTLTNGVVALWINSRRPVGIGVAHGWRPVGDLMVVTRASGNVVHELDGRPALEAYLEMRADAEAEFGAQDAPARSLAERLMDGPLGLPTTAGGYDVRHIFGEGPDGGLVMFGYVSDNAVVQVMTTSHDELLAAAQEATAVATRAIGRVSRGALVFSCTARLANLGEKVVEEGPAIARGLDGAPACGLFTYGEFGRSTGSSGFHNATVTVLAV